MNYAPSNLVSGMQDFRNAVRLGSFQGEKGVDILGPIAHDLFTLARKAGELATYVIVPACDEEQDLPPALAALSLSLDPVIPVVVANNCSPGDRTAEYADAMGADVIEMQEEGKQMGARQAGVRHVIEKGHDHALFIDGDAKAPRRWSRTMNRWMRAANNANKRKGVLAFGSSIYAGGPSHAANVLMTASRAAGDVWRRLDDNRPPLTNGHNMGLVFGSKDVVAAFLSLDPELFCGQGGTLPEDVAIREIIREQTEASIIGVPDLAARVTTRGDRVDTIGKAIRIVIGRQSYTEVVSSSYARQYE